MIDGNLEFVTATPKMPVPGAQQRTSLSAKLRLFRKHRDREAPK